MSFNCYVQYIYVLDIDSDILACWFNCTPQHQPLIRDLQPDKDNAPLPLTHFLQIYAVNMTSNCLVTECHEPN